MHGKIMYQFTRPSMPRKYVELVATDELGASSVSPVVLTIVFIGSPPGKAAAVLT